MDGWVSRTDIIAPRQLKELSRRSDLRGALQLASHVGALCVTGWALWATWGTWWAVPLFVLHGYLINTLFAAQHEGNHLTAFKTRWVNNAMTHCTGFILLYPCMWERWVHFAHHRNTGNWEKDAELLMRPKYTLGNFLLYLSGLGYWIFRVKMLFDIARGRIPSWAYWLTASQRRYVVVEARWHWVGYAIIAALSVAFDSWLAVTLWLAPMIATKPFHQLQNISEHIGLDPGLDTTKNTRTLLVPGFVRWALWNMPYHSAHHTFPGVPFHRLKDLHDAIEAKLGRPLPAAGYVEVHVKAIRALMKGPEPTFDLPFAHGGALRSAVPTPAPVHATGD